MSPEVGETVEVVVGPVVVGVDGGSTGEAVQTERPDPDDGSAGRLATAAPLRARPTTVAPARVGLPGTASTAMPEAGAMVSTTAPPVDRVTDATALPTHTATHPTGAPSALPKEPSPRSSAVSGVGAAVGGLGTGPLPTARSVESSTVNCPHPGPGWGGAVVVGPLPVLPEPPVWEGGALGAGGDADGTAHIAPFGHGAGAGTIPSGGQAAAGGQPALEPPPDA
jgi:hypothetical protein